ncbi:class I SAM-dependent methyltransferase [Burkholderia stagnalis]|uniref:class I SAM-dependent methyltransferase n=1 Tax=Burkholderia stagnalis TaxID=1503054 RepID=UPI000753564C|nr:methyltransferase domain-containing protein [Burkholderia stagnalis]KVM83140.1 hypothetical protein WT05_19705 [Burkholderia stagnalis]
MQLARKSREESNGGTSRTTRAAARPQPVDGLPFADDALDNAFSINCIYFWRTPCAAWGKLHRVVQRGGRVAITVRDIGRAPYGAFRPEQLARAMTEAGFSSVALHRNGVPSHPLACVLGAK